MREYAEVILVAVVFALFVRTFLVQAFVVPTPSMEYTVLVGDHLVVNKFLYAPHRWFRFLPYRDVRRGDVVMTLVGNRPAWVFAMVACFRLGAVVLPCTEQLRTADSGR